MFFRMIKKDLKDSKGLNVILLIFMIIVSTLAAVSALLLLCNTRGIRTSQERTNSADMFGVFTPFGNEAEGAPQRLIDRIKTFSPDAEIAWQKAIHIDGANIDFDAKDPKTFRGTNHRHYLSAQPMEMDLVYDENARPFYVENGCIAVPRQFANQVGIKVGDTMRITSQMGRVYEFTVSIIHKDATKEWDCRLMLSDGDFEKMLEDSPHIVDFVYIRNESWDIGSNLFDRQLMFDLYDYIRQDREIDDHLEFAMLDGHTDSNNAIVSLVLSIFTTAVSFLLFVIILLTLRFSIHTAIKKEERELGIMKALGADSFSFRWLFAAKYIAFAVIGGIIGVFIGVPAGRYLIDRFFENMSYAISGVDIVVAAVATASITVFVILYILVSLRRIDKISVMDAITGENRSESIGRKNRFMLTKRKKMSVPFFLALSDIFTKLRRYIMLLIAFTAGSLMVMLTVQLRDTMISKDFLTNYYDYTDLDFGLDSTPDFWKKMTLDTGRPDIAEYSVNEAFRKNNIPAELDVAYYSYANIVTDGKKSNVQMVSGTDPAKIRMIKGGQPPVLTNEIMIDKFTADSLGYNIGDTIYIEYEKYDVDRLYTKLTTDSFVITGFVDRLSNFNNSEVYMSADFNDAPSMGCHFMGFRIDAPRAEKAKYVEQIKALFPNNTVEPLEADGNWLAMYDMLLSFIRNTVVIMTACLFAFLTLMYQSIFMKNEENETAMLKSSGFDDGSVKKWQFFRMMTLFAVSQAAAAILMPTVGTKLMSSMFSTITGLCNWKFSQGQTSCIIWVAGITVIIAIVEAIVLKGIEKTEIWRIRNE
ncbi:MAG: FtsX-like permease family protein [Oscillospiraceae bacterium]|nr:FtsX-like permease family protein [Oscillospiraceae bacterium]